jgi:uncharacterized protein
MKPWATLLTVALLMGITNQTFADANGELERAKQAYRNKDPKTFVSIVKKLAHQGNAEAQYALGTVYQGMSGTGVEVDEAESAKWLTLSASQGFARAEYYVGFQYARGMGLFPQDKSESLKWYQQSAEHGFINAQHSLGMVYYLGLGVPKDYVKAYKWLHLASKKGYRMATKTEKELEEIMSPEEISKAKTLAQKWENDFQPVN